MLNVDETILINLQYIIQRDLYLKGIYYSTGAIVFINIVRSQVAEINLLQLVPGFYLVLLFISLILLVSVSDFIFTIPKLIDSQKKVGTKTTLRMLIGTRLRLSLFLLFSGLFIALNSIIPLSLDSFNSYGEKTLENLWSFNEVVNIEIILLFIVILISQLPIYAIFNLSTEKSLKFLPEFWKLLSLTTFLISGVITPTIDGYTQLSFAGSAIALYLLIISLMVKKVNVKFSGAGVMG
jgi:hypothetical protein